MPPIIDRALFDSVQAALAGHISVLRDGRAYRQSFLASFQEAQLERHRENAATEAKIADLEHTLAEQRTKQENPWEEVASLPKTATSARTALHNVLNRLDEAIAEGVEQVMALRATLHWWGMDAPLPLEEETPSGGQESGSDTVPSASHNGNGDRDIPILLKIRIRHLLGHGSMLGIST